MAGRNEIASCGTVWLQIENNSNDNRDLKIPRFRCMGTGKLPVAVHVISGGKFNLSYRELSLELNNQVSTWRLPRPGL